MSDSRRTVVARSQLWCCKKAPRPSPTPKWKCAATRHSPVAAVEARAKALTAANDPWRFSGREILALAAYKAGDMEAARREFEALTKEADVPRDFTARAEILMGLIRASASAKPAEKPAQ